MLVLSRRERERIKLGDSIVITVVRVAGDKVRIGIEAPTDMLVLRDELDVRPRPETVGEAAPSRPVQAKQVPINHGLSARVAARSASAA